MSYENENEEAKIDPSNPALCQTLADVLKVILSATDIPEHTRRDRASALRTIARITRRPLTSIPCDVKSVREVLKTVMPARHRLSPARWRNLKSLVFRSLDQAGVPRPQAALQLRSLTIGTGCSPPCRNIRSGSAFDRSPASARPRESSQTGSRRRPSATTSAILESSALVFVPARPISPRCAPGTGPSTHAMIGPGLASSLPAGGGTSSSIGTTFHQA